MVFRFRRFDLAHFSDGDDVNPKQSIGLQMLSENALSENVVHETQPTNSKADPQQLANKPPACRYLEGDTRLIRLVQALGVEA